MGEGRMAADGKVGDNMQPHGEATMTDTRNAHAVTFSGGPHGLAVSMRLTAEPSCILDFTYEEFTPVSLTQPWALTPASLESVRLERHTEQRLEVRAEAGPFALTDRWEWRGQRLWVSRCWTLRGVTSQAGVVVGTRLPTGWGPGTKVTMPGVSYNGNPSADPARLVPRLPAAEGALLVVEEHRLPVPGINAEWVCDGRPLALTLLSLPTRIVLPGAGPDHWWSLGGTYGAHGLDMLSLSGVVALNGERDMIYAGQNRTATDAAYGYLTLHPGDRLEKTLVLDFGPVEAEGRGFRRMVRGGWDIWRPHPEPALTPAQTIALKRHALEQRWRPDGGGGGFLVATPTREEGNIYDRAPGFLFGWTGQSLRLAWCALALGLTEGDQGWSDRGQAVLDAFADAPAPAETPGLRPMYYALAERRWYADAKRQSARFSSRMVGEALTNLADCLLLLRAWPQWISPRWTAALREGLDFLASPDRTNSDGVFPAIFDRRGQPADGFSSAAGLPGVVALLRGAEVLADAALQRRGLELLARYDDLFARTFVRPFSRSTLDAACEDKEAGLYFFLAAYHAFRLTGDKRLADSARVAAEWAATFVYCWEAELPASSACARLGLRTSCWSSVSVQNHHLDVFFFPWEIHDLGRRLQDPFLQELGLGVLQAWTHGIARSAGAWGYPTPGEQGEAFFQTNWSTDGSGRGGFNPWNPSWIVGMVLQATLRFAHPRLNA